MKVAIVGAGKLGMAVTNTLLGGAHAVTIIDIDDSTANVLFVISLDNGHQVLIPAVDNFISDIDIDNRMIEFNVPQDLLDL